MLSFRTIIVACSLVFCVAFATNLSAQKKKPSKDDIKKMLEKKKEKPKKASLDKLLQGDASAWDLTPETFEKQWMPFFKWMKKDEKTGARYHMLSMPHKLDVFGYNVWEAVARFKEGKLNEMEISLYNRGDAGARDHVTVIANGKPVKKPNLHWDGKKFHAVLKGLNEKINAWLGIKGKVMPPRKLVGTSQDAIYEEYWVKGDRCVGLQWSGTQASKTTFRPAYLKLVYCKFDPHNDPRKMMTRAKNAGRLANVKNIKNNVQHKDDFTYVDNIPMVDQGPKGYCAVAATERILRYYGSEVDQHQIAQVVGTADRGTEAVKMFTMLQKAGPRLGVKMFPYLEPPDLHKDYSNDRRTRDYVKNLEKFNKFLKKKGERAVPYAYPLCSIMGSKDRLAYLKIYKCEKCKREFSKFKSNIKKNIDQGMPIAWGLIVGIVPEEGREIPQGGGGHMRLIIGYNKDFSKLVFTDTWGAGHEFKTIDTEDAWIVTTFYFVFKPSKKY